MKRIFSFSTLTVIVLAVAVAMNINISIASETYTVNTSPGYLPLQESFVHDFATSDGVLSACTASIDSTGDCDSWGAASVSAWINDTFFAGMGDGSVSTSFVAGYDARANSGYQLPATFNTFSTLDNPTQGELLSTSLPADWVTALRVEGEGSSPLTAPNSTTSIKGEDNPNQRETYIDQIVIGYISTGDNFAMNFRASLTFGDSNYNPSSSYDGENFKRDLDCKDDHESCATILDQTLEQGDTDMEAKADGKSSKRVLSAFQQTFSAVGNAGNVSSSATDSVGAGQAKHLSQNIEFAASFFYSCMNCGTDVIPPPAKSLLYTDPLIPTISSIIHSYAATQTNSRWFD